MTVANLNDNKGFFVAAIFTLSLETGVECTYPIPEGTTAGLQLLCAQIFGIVFTTSTFVTLLCCIWIMCWTDSNHVPLAWCCSPR